jgi:alkaline phosphatase D
MAMGGHRFNPDAWDGYAANQDRIVAGLADSPVRNAVVLTGDVHLHWAAEVHERFDDPSSSVATELVATSISSGGDGSDSRDDIAAVLAENPTFGTSTTVAPRPRRCPSRW